MTARKRPPDSGERIRFWVNSSEQATLRALAGAWSCTPAQAAKRLLSLPYVEAMAAMARKELTA